MTQKCEIVCGARDFLSRNETPLIAAGGGCARVRFSSMTKRIDNGKKGVQVPPNIQLDNRFDVLLYPQMSIRLESRKVNS